MPATEVLFVQGAGDRVHDEWDRKLFDSLRRELGRQYEVQYPRMPNEAEPSLVTWRPVLEDALTGLPAGAIVVGHSIGGTIVAEVLATLSTRPPLAAFVLIAAPYIGSGGWPSDEIASQHDLGARLPASLPVLLYHGDADESVPVAHMERYAAAIPRARVTRLAGRDHQLDNDLSEVARDLRELGLQRADRA
jgi:hypothetical protein